MSDLRRMTDHSAWANRAWMDFIQAHGWAQRPAQLLSHVVLGEAAWLDRIAARPLDREIFRVLPRFEIAERIAHHQQILQRLCAGRLDTVVAYQRFNGDAHASPISDIVMHLVTHGFHHRAQIASHYAQLRVAGPATDYITFCRVFAH